MGKIPKISYDALTQVIEKTGDMYKKVETSNPKKIMGVLLEHMKKLEKSQPVIYEWLVSLVSSYRVIGIEPGAGELLLSVIVFNEALIAQQEIDDLANLFKKSIDENTEK